MNLLHRLMDKIGRYRLIPDRRTGEDYMHRYYLFLKDRTKFPFNVTMHKIVKSDDPIYHDHPWSYVTVVLWGGYNEHTPIRDNKGKIIGDFVEWRGPGSIIKRKAQEYHWLELKDEKPATTIFFMGKQKRQWGFLVKTKPEKHRWIHNEYYLKDWKSYHEKYVLPKAANRKKQ